MPKKIFIISLGGSLIATDEGINHSYLKKFRELILKQIKKGHKFFLIAGGGVTARSYIRAADKITKVTDDDRDWLGIHSTRLNAHLVRTIFKKEAHRQIVKNPTFHMHTNKKIIVSGGWKPGWSTDYVATMIAQEYEIPTVINLSNIDYAYDKDPRKHKNAKKMIDITWKDFRKIVGDKWSPGQSAPFDPIASRKGDQLGLKVIIANGTKLKNLEKIFNDEKYNGTTIN